VWSFFPIRYGEERQKLIVNTSTERVHQKQVPDIQSPMETCRDVGRVQRSTEPEGVMSTFDRKVVHEFDDFKAPARKQLSHDEYDKQRKFVENPVSRGMVYYV